MQIEFNKVTWYSIVMAIILYVVTFGLGFCLGFWTNSATKPLPVVQPQTQQTKNTESVINSATFLCDGNKSIQAIFFKDKVELTLSDKRSMLLNQAISASGARYANPDESFVFWNKGNTAFVQEGNVSTYQNCITGR